MIASIAAVSLGAAAGACLRWVLGLLLANVFTAFALGTLAANWIGGLTTFSGFSLEIIAMLQEQRYVTALMTAALHLFGSLVLTALGIWCMQGWRG